MMSDRNTFRNMFGDKRISAKPSKIRSKKVLKQYKHPKSVYTQIAQGANKLIKKIIIKAKKIYRGVKSVASVVLNKVRGRDNVYPIRAEIAKGKASGIIPGPDYKTTTKSGPVPHGKFHKGFYNSKLGPDLKPGEKFAYLRRAHRSAKVLDKLAAREGKIIDTWKRFKTGFRASAIVHQSFNAFRRGMIGAGKVLAKLGIVGKTINKVVTKVTRAYYRSSLTKLKANPHLKYVPYSHTNTIREKIGAIRLAGIGVGAVGAGVLAYRAVTKVKKALISRQEHNKRISVGLLKSTKVKNRRRKR